MPEYVTIELDVPDLLITTLDGPLNEVEDESQTIGSTWLKKGTSLGLIVPSRIIPLERNVLLNPTRWDVGRVRIERIEPFAFDDRLTY